MNTLLVLVGATLATASPLALQSRDLSASTLARRDSSLSNSVNIQLFGWNWDSVAAECTNFIGPAGYGYITVSPVSEHITGDEWWVDYQVVSYKLNSARGTREQFKSMVDTCHAVGVKVLTDTIFNHMANLDSRSGVDGSTFTHYDYPGIYQYQDFHQCGLDDGGNNIVHWEVIPEVQICELSGLADLNTSSTYVQGMVASHADDLLSLGVDGFRLDAAKQISVPDLQALVDAIGDVKPSYMFLEVPVPYDGVSDVIPGDYTEIGDVNEFRYANALRLAFRGGDLTTLKDLTVNGWLDSSSAAVFVTNHDTERSSGTNALNNNAPNNAYELAHIFMLSHDYGVLPTILSSYAGFDETPDAGPPNNAVGNCDEDVGFLCQHRWTSVVGMTGFHNAVRASSDDTSLGDWTAEGTTRIAFGRGSAGFVAINNNAAAWQTEFTTSLADGVYCNVVDGSLSNGACTNSSITVTDGSFSVSISPYWAMAIHVDSMVSAASASMSASASTSATSASASIFTSEVVASSSDASSSSIAVPSSSPLSSTGEVYIASSTESDSATSYDATETSTSSATSTGASGSEAGYGSHESSSGHHSSGSWESGHHESHQNGGSHWSQHENQHWGHSSNKGSHYGHSASSSHGEHSSGKSSHWKPRSGHL